MLLQISSMMYISSRLLVSKVLAEPNHLSRRKTNAPHYRIALRCKTTQGPSTFSKHFLLGQNLSSPVKNFSHRSKVEKSGRSSMSKHPTLCRMTAPIKNQVQAWIILGPLIMTTSPLVLSQARTLWQFH